MTFKRAYSKHGRLARSSLFAVIAWTVSSCGHSTDPVTRVPATVVLSTSSLQLTWIRETISITTVVKDQDGQVLPNEVRWTSADPTVASVSRTGAITAEANGATTVTARAGNASASISVMVTQVIAGLSVSPTEVVLVSIGASTQLNAAPHDSGNTEVPGATASWLTADPSVAAVSASGLVTAVATGITSVTAQAAGAMVSVPVTVRQEPQQLAIAPASLTLLGLGGTGTLAAMARDGNGVTIPDPVVDWVSSDPTIVNVASTGAVTAVAPGTAVITASAGSASSTAVVTVSPNQDPADAGLVHRWSFEQTGGPGTVLTDDIGTAHGTIVSAIAAGPRLGRRAVAGSGSTASAQYGQVTLDGGAQATADYVALPPGLLSSLRGATVEIWATPHSLKNWSRIIDIGAGTTNYLFLAWSQGTDVATDRGAFAVNGVEARLDNMLAPYALHLEHHIVITVDEGAGAAGTTRVTLYRDGQQRGSFDTSHRLSQLMDSHFWLGRSPFPVDETAHASFNELSIYDRVLSADQVAAKTAVGPHGSGAAVLDHVSIMSATNPLYVGTQVAVTVQAFTASGNVLPYPVVTWTSSNPTVATVGANGVVSGLAPGSVTVTAVIGGKQASVSFTVTRPPSCVDQVPPGNGPLPSTTNVLMDLSHEFTFTYDIYAHHAPYWNPGFGQTGGNADLASASAKLDEYDILIINQGETGVTFGDAEMQRLEHWVRDDGGRLVLTARGIPGLPMGQLAARFGIEFSTSLATKPYQVKAHPATTGISEFTTANFAAPGTVLGFSCDCNVLVTDALQQPVVLDCPQGAGRVIAISEPAFIANPYAQEIVNVQFNKQLMSWLGRRPRADAVVPWEIVPDVEMQLSGGARLHYTSHTASSTFVGVVQAQATRIDQELQAFTGLLNVFQMTFRALPCAGGGWSSGPTVAVCSFDSDAGSLTLTLAHELMHSFDNPNPPPEMMHPVVSYVATKVAAALGGAVATTAAAEKQAWDAGFKAADPTGTTIDVTNDAVFDRRGKMYWIMGRLDGTYPFSTTNLYDFPTAAHDPANVLRRYYQLKRLDAGYTPTPTNIVRLLSIAACLDLFPHFRAVGTTLGATPAALSAEIASACP